MVKAYWPRLAAFSVVVGLAAAPPALAGTASVVISEGSATLFYRAAPGERNALQGSRRTPGPRPRPYTS